MTYAQVEVDEPLVKKAAAALQAAFALLAVTLPTLHTLHTPLTLLTLLTLLTPCASGRSEEGGEPPRRGLQPAA